ncbi:MAG: hypothetical protein AB7O78_10560 [Thermoleophilia bacterium]
MLAGLSGAVYAAAGRPPALGGWVSDAAGTAAITLRHEGHLGDAGTVLDVETWRPGDADADAGAVAARTLRDAVANATPGGSPDTWARGVADARPDVVEISIDGTPAPFARLALGDLWAAARVHDDVVIAVCARAVGPGEVRLERVGPAALRRSLLPGPPGP